MDDVALGCGFYVTPGTDRLGMPADGPASGRPAGVWRRRARTGFDACHFAHRVKTTHRRNAREIERP